MTTNLNPTSAPGPYNWTDSANWDNGVPGAADDATIGVGSTASFTVAVDGISVDTALTLTIDDPNVTVLLDQSSPALQIAEQLTMNGGTLAIFGANFQVGADNLVDGTLTLNSGAVIVGDGLLGSNSGLTVLDAAGTNVGTLAFNGGTVIASASGTINAFEVFATIVGDANFHIENGASLLLDAGVAAGGVVTFDGGTAATGVFVDNFANNPIGNPGDLSVALRGFDVGSGSQQLDSIDIAGEAAATAAWDGTTLVVTKSAGVDRFDLGSGYGAFDTIGTIADGSGGTMFFLDSVCFEAGTHILTKHGSRPVETLSAGDLVAVEQDGEQTFQPVKWMGSRTIDLTRHPRIRNAAPIRIAAGAFGDNLPLRQLSVSPEHCMFLDGKLVPAKLLINGATIRQDTQARSVTYYHVETESHSILLAEGVPAESYLDTGNRSFFSNAGLATTLHPEFDVNSDLSTWQHVACAPFATTSEEIAPIWQKLADRADSLNIFAPKQPAVEDPDLHIIVDGRRLQPVSDRDSRYVFAVPAGARSVTISSRKFVPADKMVAAERDTRMLGVSVDWVAIRSSGNETILTADHPALTTGWHGTENAGGRMYRWTDGAASIPWDDVHGPAMVTIRCASAGWYPIIDQEDRLVA